MNIALNATAYAVNEIHTSNISGASSSIKTLDFSINNMESFSGFQFDLSLPQPITYKTGTSQLFRNQDHTVSVNQINNQTLRIVCFSAAGKNFTENSGKILSLDFLLFGNAGYYSVGISNVIIANTAGENIVSYSYGGQLEVTCPYISTSSQLSFGDVSILSSSTLQQRIYNYGQEALTIHQLQFSNTFFKSNQILPITIQPNNYFDLLIEFTKNVKGSTNCTLKIFSNDPTNSQFSVQISGNAFIPNYLLINSQYYLSGESKHLDIEVENEEPFVAMQFDLNYPSGFTPDLNSIKLTNRKQDHILSATALSATSLRILVFSPEQKPFTEKSGPILNIPFKAESNLPLGTYDLIFSNALISNTKSENILYASRNGFLNITLTTELDSDIDNSEIRIFQNHTSGNLQVKGLHGIAHFTLIDMSGKVIIRKQLTNNEYVSINNLPKGLFIAKLINKQGIFEKKILKI
jgi:archaellin